MGLPTGTITFLFTDIQRSTRMWEEHDEEMNQALTRHDEIMREAIGNHDGYVFTTAGDAFRRRVLPGRSGPRGLTKAPG